LPLAATVGGLRQQETPRGFSIFFAYPGADEAQGEAVFLPERSEDDWSRLLGHTETLRFGAGDLVIRAGEEDRALYIVAEGTLEVLFPDGRGELRRHRTVEPRSVIGEVAFLDARPRSATIRALTDGVLVRLTFDTYEVLAARYPELGRAILLGLGRIVAGRLRRADEALAQPSE
jgi:CRP/FNR family cyclic AMP-dependent transcriptional regulator